MSDVLLDPRLVTPYHPLNRFNKHIDYLVVIGVVVINTIVAFFPDFVAVWISMQ